MRDIDFRIARMILRTGRKLLHTREGHLTDYGISSSQAECIIFVNTHPGAFIIDLKEYLEISHQSTCELIEKLKKKNLVETRTSDRDKRARQIFLTPQGQQICEDLRRRGTDVGTSLLNALSNDEKDILENILKKISNETV